MKIKLYNTISFNNYKLNTTNYLEVTNLELFGTYRIIGKYLMKCHNTHNQKEITNTSMNTSLFAENRSPKQNGNKSTKSHFLDFFIISFKIAVKSVYKRVHSPYLHQFQCHTM